MVESAKKPAFKRAITKSSYEKAEPELAASYPRAQAWMMKLPRAGKDGKEPGVSWNDWFASAASLAAAPLSGEQLAVFESPESQDDPGVIQSTVASGVRDSSVEEARVSKVLRMVFDCLDANGDGELCLDDLEPIVRGWMGEKGESATEDEVLAALDPIFDAIQLDDDSDAVSFIEFSTYIKKSLTPEELSLVTSVPIVPPGVEHIEAIAAGL